MLYIRMLLSIAVSLYTSRVVLQTLGVDDFGIYGVVGGIVAMFSFLNASMSGATSRFITFSLGKGDVEDTKETFATALLIHIGIALAIVLLAETVGLWFLENKLVIPSERMNAARVVYQFSILAMAVQVIQVPYNASIISYEKMDVYAYVELLNVFLKLGIVYLLVICNYDKLILYAILVFSVNFLISCIYRIYCIRNFSTCRFYWTFNREKFVPMLSFSGWDMYGNMCYSFRQQGLNMLINMFFGVAFNAASSVATSIQSVIASLSANVIQAFRPQIIKNYAKSLYAEMQTLMKNALKYTLLLFLMISVPVFFEMETVINVWLGQVPAYAPAFCRVMLCISLLNLINSVLGIAIGATGNVKRISFISGSVYLLSLPIIYVLFKYVVDNAIFAYVVSLGIMFTVVAVNFGILKKQIPQLQILAIINGIWHAFLCASVSIVPLLFVTELVAEPLLRLFSVFATYVALLSIVVLISDKPLRTFVFNKIHGMIH